MMCRVGSVVAPFCVYLADIWIYLPQVLYINMQTDTCYDLGLYCVVSYVNDILPYYTANFVLYIDSTDLTVILLFSSSLLEYWLSSSAS